MKVRCLHGYFIIEETRVAQASDFMRLTNLEIIPKGRHFTFKALDLAPEYTLQGKPITGVGKTPITALKTFAGEPWEVFEANEIVFNFQLGILQPIAAVTQVISISDGGNRFVSNGLILPGSITADGQRVKDYAAWYSRETQRFLYSEVTFV